MIGLFVSLVASAQAPPDGPRASLSVQLLEVISVERGHIATLIAPGVSVLTPLTDRWSLVGVAGLSVGIDQTALGGVIVLTPQAGIWHDGPWHASVGPTLGISRVYTREETWQARTNLSLGGGMSLGKRGTVGQLGLEFGTTPEFDWAISVIPRLGVSAAF